MVCRIVDAPSRFIELDCDICITMFIELVAMAMSPFSLMPCKITDGPIVWVALPDPGALTDTCSALFWIEDWHKLPQGVQVGAPLGKKEVGLVCVISMLA